jgi:hypothetical protein
LLFKRPDKPVAIVLESDETVNITPPHLSTTFDLVDKACARFIFQIDPFAKADSEVQRGPDSLPGKGRPRTTSTSSALPDSLVLVLPRLMARIEMFLLVELFCLKSLPWAKLSA